jgi:hypothetical protein
MQTVAALFVDPKGVYANLPDVEVWDEARDARKYAGPWPVVAHPPCARWCRLAGLVEARWGHKKGDDGGCFESARDSLLKWGGVLEHPAWSDAFTAFGLPIPIPDGGWQRGIDGGWSCHVEQWHYGHAAKKATWLYVYGVDWLPSLTWGTTPDNAETALDERWSSRSYVSDGGLSHARRSQRAPALVSWCGNHVKSGEDRPRLGKKAASATPPAFRDLLLNIARSARHDPP